MTNDYVPIACDAHSVLELLALRRRPVEIAYRAVDGDRASVQARVVDLRTRDGAEYLEIETSSGSAESIRLDRIVAIRDGGAQVFPVNNPSS